MELNHTGIITMSNECIMYNDRIQLAAHTVININDELKYIVNNITPNTEEENITKIHEYVIEPDDLALMNTNFEDIKQKIKQDKVLQEKLSIINERTEYFGINFGWLIVTLISIVATIVIAYLKFKKRKGPNINVTLNTGASSAL